LTDTNAELRKENAERLPNVDPPKGADQSVAALMKSLAGADIEAMPQATPAELKDVAASAADPKSDIPGGIPRLRLTQLTQSSRWSQSTQLILPIRILKANPIASSRSLPSRAQLLRITRR